MTHRNPSSTPPPELVERLCDFHKRLLLCFEGATGERPPARPRPFEPEWQDTETLLDAASFAANPVQEATRTVGDAELTSKLVEKIERRMVALEAFTGSTGRYADRHGKWTVKSFIAELRALSHTSSCGGI